ncbi:MAG: 3-deoxy-7-phosphoheptulonate synthase [Halioglobus sp.]|jgi:3-deoxy-7-phosphoheptulonate synthase|nr:3-deoxy-7-phosphoheptulonate synthase [Halieaceae bacterium]MBT6123614.1 3-deoxy-7-phosphoheptulonate synthase [Halieaceae bacterium]MBT7718139.1 3-deoxy-7-phosphoheptulonate synthase [Halieaceae bacterium]MDG1389692.1 3-deoxy-7-phosphoheptulonate synthase [Halioglobus sp.]MDG2325739.1 3-deoxy-7-phosphoheptulonate synthase [Halioglobus sp.]
MSQNTDDIRIDNARPLITPWVLADQLPGGATAKATVSSSRRSIEQILAGNDPRLVVIAGPCSVHDPVALLDFAHQFQAACEPLADTLLPVLRVYFEKPRTIVGWKGLINDPDLDGSFHINKGLHLARKVLLDVAELGLPAASEFLDNTFGQYYADLVSFGAIGARTVESQIHRELASGLSMPVGFKNGTNGHIDVAIDAIQSAAHSHWFPSLTKEGTPAILKSRGNPHGYLILRGGKQTGPNYGPAAVQQASVALAESGLTPSLIVDCSHGNSEKDPQRQTQVVSSLCEQIQTGQSAIKGVMLESHLLGGSQDIGDGSKLSYGQSITDACLSLKDTIPLLQQLAAAVKMGATQPG